MNPEEIAKANDVLSWVAERMAHLPEHRDEAMQAALMCQGAALILGELMVHLARGVDPYEALRRTAVGELIVPQSKVDLMKTVRGQTER